MGNINTAALSGNLTRDPELRTFGDDGAVANLGLAVNRQRFDKKTEEYVNEVSFFDVTVWGGFAKLTAKKLKKGDAVSIKGRLEQQTWDQDGQKRSKIVLIAEDIDSEGYFRSKDENNAVEETPAAASTSSSSASADDDIPF